MGRFTRIVKGALLPAFGGLLLVGPSILADGGGAHRVRTVNFGVSGGNVNDSSRRFCCSGTLGSLIRDSSGTDYVLSNNHVLGRSGRATAGEDVSQPGLIDSGCGVSTVIADFTLAPALSSGVDTAIAQLRSGMMDSGGSIQDIGTISSVVRLPTIGLSVAKSGRTTGFTTGTISSISATINVSYPRSCGSNGGGSTFTFPNQIVIGPGSFSSGGDSGSLIVTNDNCHQPVGLLFAGSSTSTIANPASVVLTRIGASLGRTVSFVGDTCTSGSAQLLADSADRQVDIGLSAEAIEYATATMNERGKGLMSKAGVIGVGVGASDTNSAEAVIVVYVDTTSPARARLPKTLNGLRVKKVFTEPFVAF